MDEALAKKLQVKEGRTARVMGAPKALTPRLDGMATSGRGPFDVVLLFAADQAALAARVKTAIAALGGASIFWVAYPKKGTTLASDLDRDHGWEPLTGAGFDPVSQIALDETWSALRWKQDPALREARAARGSPLAPKKATASEGTAGKKKTAELKTRPTGSDVAAFLATVPDAVRRDDGSALLAMMRKVTGAEPKLWGPSIIGFGDVHLRYESGRELDWFVCGFSPRKDSLVLYGILAHDGAVDALLAKLGKHKVGKGCLYIKKLADVDVKVLEQLVHRAAAREG